jgi:hypothetical protein
MERQLNKQHVLRLSGSLEEIQRLRNNIATNYANRRIIDEILAGKDIEPTQELQGMYKELALAEISKWGDKIWTDIKKDYFKNIDFEVDVEITGEGRDVYAQMRNAELLLTTIQKDPTVLTDPAKKRILFKAMSVMGWNMAELERMETETIKAADMPIPSQAGNPSPYQQQPAGQPVA